MQETASSDQDADALVAGFMSGPGPEGLLLQPMNHDWYMHDMPPVVLVMPVVFGVDGPQLDERFVLDALVRHYGDLDPEVLMVRPTPGAIAITPETPVCDGEYCQVAARFDLAVETRSGFLWRNLCVQHAREQGLAKLSMGRAQYLMHPDELDTPVRRVAMRLAGVEPDEVLGTHSSDWTRIYHGFGFVRETDTRLIRRGPSTTIRAELVPDLGAIGLTVRRYRAFVIDSGDWSAVVPPTWSADPVRSMLFKLLDRDFDLPGSVPLSIDLAEAEQIVLDRLTDRDHRTRIRQFLSADDLATFGHVTNSLLPSSYGRAGAIVATESRDLELVRRVYFEHPDWGLRFDILWRADCPLDLLIAATEEPSGRGALLSRKTLPTEIVEPLFTKVALSSTSVDGTSVMWEATLHPTVPLPLVEGLLEKVLSAKGHRANLVHSARDLVPAHRDIVWTGVLRKTHRGMALDDVMEALLGEQGLDNREVVAWLGALSDRRMRERALRWIETQRNLADELMLTDGLSFEE